MRRLHPHALCIPLFAMADGLIQTLTRLLEEGRVPWSSVSERQRDRLRPLLETNVVAVERSGSGRRLIAHNEERVRQFAEKEYPSGLEAARAATSRDGDTPLSASEAVAHLRDAKRGAAGDEVLLFRGAPETTITYEGSPFRVGQLTETVGVAAVVLGADTSVAVDGPLAVVENREAFLRFEALGTAAQVACFGGGRLSRRVVAWLAALDVGAGDLLHCPDYDPVGLDEFQRLREACGARVRLFWPERLEALLQKYGKARLYTKNAHLLDGIGRSAPPTIAKLRAMLHRHGQGLEQEILLHEALQGRRCREADSSGETQTQ